MTNVALPLESIAKKRHWRSLVPFVQWSMPMLDRRRLIQTGLGVLGFVPFASRIARAQSYPSRPVRVIVGLPAGSAPDVIARFIGQSLAGRLGQPFVVENRPGAATNLAAELVVRAKADGYTLLVVTATNAVNASLYENLKFNFVRDTAPIGGIAAIPFILVVSPSFPAKTVSELIAYAKANPGKVVMATTGIGGIPHAAGEMFMMMAGIDMLPVPYGGSDVAAITELIAGRAHVYFGPVLSVIEQLKAGTLRAIAVTTRTRVDALPEIPAVAEFVPGYDATGWVGIAAPAGTSPEIIDRLNAGINSALAVPGLQRHLADFGAPPLAGSTGDFGNLIADETEKWAKVIKFAGIKVE